VHVTCVHIYAEQRMDASYTWVCIVCAHVCVYVQCVHVCVVCVKERDRYRERGEKEREAKDIGYRGNLAF
jgi:hypothetical protein